MGNNIWNITKRVLGILLILGGILGLFLPFFQGIAMIIAGAVLLENKFVIKKTKQFIAYIKRLKKRYL